MTDGREATRASTGWRRYATFEALLYGLNSLGTLWIIVLMIVINIDVFGRTALQRPLPGVLELVTLSIVGIIFLQIGSTVRAGRITRSDALFRAALRRWPRFAFSLQMLYHLAGAMVFAVLFHASFPFLISSWNSGEYEGIQGYVTYPVWPVRLTILIGSACAAVQYLLLAWSDLGVASGRRPPPEDLGDSAGMDVLQ